MGRTRTNTFPGALRVAVAFVALLFVVEVADLALRRSQGLTLTGFGIVPRTTPGFAGIFLAPLLHAGPAHLLANALPIFVLLVLLFWDRHYHPWLTLGMIWFASGFGTWLIGRNAVGSQPMVHVGASSLIFGLVTYLIVCGFIMRSWRSVLVAAGVLIVFGGTLLTIAPGPGSVSWEGHFCGALAGIWAAYRNHE